jgi:hypothetical protein
LTHEHSRQRSGQPTMVLRSMHGAAPDQHRGILSDGVS